MKKLIFILPIIFFALFSIPSVAPVAHASDCMASDGSPGTLQSNGTCLSDTNSGSGGIQGNGGGNTGNSIQGNGGGNTGNNSTTLLNPLQGGTSLETFLNNILKFVVRIGSIVVILMLVYVGFLFVVARGNSDKISEARNALLWTVVGALILLGAQAISLGIQATVNAISSGN